MTTLPSKFFAMSTLAIFVAGALGGCLGNGPGGGSAAGCAEGSADENLKVGTLLPITGSLQAFGPDMKRAVELAAEQINAAGGVNGKQVQLFHQDSKTSPTDAPNAFNTLVNNGVVAIVGAAGSSVTASILDSAIDNNIVVVTPASTSPVLTNETRGDNSGFFYRVPPSDSLQGRVLAKLVKENHTTVRILAVNNAYGQGLGGVFKQAFTDLGGTVQGDIIFFESGGTTFATQVTNAAPATGGPEAVVLIAYPTEGSAIMKEAHATGATQRAEWYFSEGLFDSAFVTGSGETATGDSILEGFKGTTPQALSPDENQSGYKKFADAYRAEYPSDANGPGLFAAESYDAMWAIALAAQCGGDNTAAAIKAKARDIMSGPGTAVEGSTGTAALDAAGTGDVDYSGASGNFDWDANGDPTSGVYAYWRITDGEIEVYQTGVQAE